MLITDSQVHMWEVERPDRPWIDNGGRVPPAAQLRPDGFTAEMMLAEMDAAGVDRAVIVPPIYLPEDNFTALDTVAKHPKRFAIMGRFNPIAADARERLQGWLQQSNMLGIRFHLGAQPYATMLEDGRLDWFWAECERLGVPVMVHLPGMAEKAQPIVQRHPGLTLVIDHMAAINGKGADACFSTIDNLLALAAFPRVYVKVSTIPVYSGEAYPFADTHPYLRRIYDSFGPGRLMWGADITRLHCPYIESLDVVRYELDFLSDRDKEQMLGGTLAKALNWPEPKAL